MVNWMIVAYVIMILVLIGIFAVGYATVDWEAILMGQCEFPEIVCNALKTAGFPGAWLTYKNLIWRCIVPLVGIGIIFYGFLSKLGFFGRGINIALAVVGSISTVPSGVFVIFVAVLFATIGIYAVVLFGALAVMAFSLAFAGRSKLGASGAIFREMDQQIGKIRDKKRHYEKEEKEALKERKKIEDKMSHGLIDAKEGAAMIKHQNARIRECKMMQKTCDAEVEEIKDLKRDVKEDIKTEEKAAPD